MLIYCTADAEKDADMKRLKSEEAITILKDMKVDIPVPKAAVTQIKRNEAIEMAINALKCSEILNSSDTISRQAAIDAVDESLTRVFVEHRDIAEKMINKIPPAQPEIVRCKDCEYGEQDEVGRWFCRSLGCQIGNEDGSGYCADAERRTND